MKRRYTFLLFMITFICISCNKDEQSTCLLSSKDISSDATTRTSYIGGTITGEKNPYVGDGTYKYTLSFSKQNSPIGIKISAVGGEAKIRNPSTNRYETNFSQSIPKGSTQYSFDVLWTKTESSAALMVRPYYNSTIELNADLRNINVKMKPLTINAPATIELGNEIIFWCNYPLNKDTNIKWIYDNNSFSEISQSASVTQGKFQINLKSIQPFKTSYVSVEIYDFFTNVIGAKEYFLVRKGDKDLFNIGPQISGNSSLTQYNTYTYQFNVSSDLSNIQWEENEYIRYIGERKQYIIQLNPIKAGKSTIRVSYNYKKCTERFYNSIAIAIASAYPSIIGSKKMCYNTVQDFSIEGLPTLSTILWSTSGGISSTNYTEKIFTCKNSSSTTTTATLNAQITLPSKYSFSISKDIQLFNPSASFNKGYIGDDSHVEVDKSKAIAEVYLYNYPNWASNFTWSSSNVRSIDLQGYFWTQIHYDSFSSETTEVEVKVRYQSPCGDWYEVSKAIPIVRISK